MTTNHFALRGFIRQWFLRGALLGLLAAEAGAGLTAIYAAKGNAIYRIDPVTGVATTATQAGFLNTGAENLALGPDGVLYTRGGAAGASVIRVDPATGGQTAVATASELTGFAGIAVGPTGQIYVMAGGDTIYRVDPVSGQRFLVAQGGLLDSAGANLAAGADGYLYAQGAPESGTLRTVVVRVDPVTGAQTVVADSLDLLNYQGLAVGPGGDIYVRRDTTVFKINPVTGAVAPVAAGSHLTGGGSSVAVGADGQIYTGGYGNSCCAQTAVIGIDPGTGSQTVIGASALILGFEGLAAGPTRPELAVEPASRNFGSVFVGSTNALAFAVINRGGATLTGTATVAAGAFAISNGSPYTVTGGSTGTVTVTFHPLAFGTVTGTVVWASNGGTSSNRVIGIGSPPSGLLVSPTVLDFGNVVTGLTTQASLTLTNLGNVALNGSATIDAGPFAILSGTPFNVGALAATNLVLQFTPPAEGAFSNQVVVSTSAGDGTNIVRGAGVIAPLAAFTGSPTNGIAPLPVTFTDASTGTITNRSWWFGDGGMTNTTATTVAHTYFGGGTPTVTLVVSGPAGTNALTRAGYLTIAPPPDLVAPVLVVAVPTNYQVFAASNITASGTATDPSGVDSVSVNGSAAILVTTNWSRPLSLSLGTNTLTVVARDATLLANSTTAIVHAIFTPPAPVASFAADPIDGVAPLSVAFTDASTGWITNRVWSFGDGGASTNLNPSHVYSNAGPYAVSLTVTGPGGSNKLTRANYIVVSAVPDTTPPVLAVFAPFALQTFSASNITATGSATDTSGVQSVTINGVLATLTATNWSGGALLVTGSNTLTVVAVDASPAANAATQTVKVIYLPLPPPAPQAAFNATPTTGHVPLTVLFTDQSTGTITNRLWSFGDGGTTTNATSTSHVYRTAGAFTVSLTVTGPGGIGATNRPGLVSVTADNPPVLVAGPVVTNAVLQVESLFVVLAGTPAIFRAVATDPDSDTVTYRWEFGEGQAGTGPTAGHLYLACQPYAAAVTISDGTLSNRTALTVSVPCTGAVTSLQLKVNFAKAEADSAKLEAAINPGPGFDPAGQRVIVDIGGATLSFTLDAKGKGTAAQGTCQFKFDSKANTWTVKASFKKGSWSDAWADDGLLNDDVPKPGVTVHVPVIIVVGDDSFMAEPVLTYTATAGKSGQAK